VEEERKENGTKRIYLRNIFWKNKKLRKTYKVRKCKKKKLKTYKNRKKYKKIKNKNKTEELVALHVNVVSSG